MSIPKKVKSPEHVIHNYDKVVQQTKAADQKPKTTRGKIAATKLFKRGEYKVSKGTVTFTGVSNERLIKSIPSLTNQGLYVNVHVITGIRVNDTASLYIALRVEDDSDMRGKLTVQAKIADKRQVYKTISKPETVKRETSELLSLIAKYSPVKKSNPTAKIAKRSAAKTSSVKKSAAKKPILKNVGPRKMDSKNPNTLMGMLTAIYRFIY